MQKLKPLNKKGVLGLNLVGSVIMTLLTLAVITIAVFLALTSLNNAGIFTAGTQTANDTNTIINNITSGTTSFFKQIPTIMTVLGVVVLILAVAIIIVAVRRFGGGGAETGL